jgi:hypothetical protein
MAVVTLWMGVGSAYITRRTAVVSQTVIDQVNPQRLYEGAEPTAAPPANHANASVLPPALLKKISTERRAPL